MRSCWSGSPPLYHRGPALLISSLSAPFFLGISTIFKGLRPKPRDFLTFIAALRRCIECSDPLCFILASVSSSHKISRASSFQDFGIDTLEQKIMCSCFTRAENQTRIIYISKKVSSCPIGQNFVSDFMTTPERQTLREIFMTTPEHR